MLHHTTAYYGVLGHNMHYSILRILRACYNTALHATSHHSILRNTLAGHGIQQYSTARYIMPHPTTSYYEIQRRAMAHCSIRRKPMACHGILWFNRAQCIMLHHSKACWYIKNSFIPIVYDYNKNNTVFKRYFHFGFDSDQDHAENWDI